MLCCLSKISAWSGAEMLIWKTVFVQVWCLNSRKGFGEVHRKQVWGLSPGTGAVPKWPGASLLKVGNLLSLFQKKSNLRPFLKPVFLWLTIQAYLQLIHLRAGFFCCEGGTIVSDRLNPLSSYWFWFFFQCQNIHAYFLWRASRNFLRGIRSDKALNISVFLITEVLTACGSYCGLVSSFSLLLIFWGK